MCAIAVRCLSCFDACDNNDYCYGGADVAPGLI
jgi:hypothetical protein